MKFTNDERIRADDRRFHKVNTMVDDEFEEGHREAERKITVPYEYSPVQLQPSTPLPSVCSPHPSSIHPPLINFYVVDSFTIYYVALASGLCDYQWQTDWFHY